MINEIATTISRRVEHYQSHRRGRAILSEIGLLLRLLNLSGPILGSEDHNALSASNARRQLNRVAEIFDSSRIIRQIIMVGLLSGQCAMNDIPASCERAFEAKRQRYFVFRFHE